MIIPILLVLAGLFTLVIGGEFLVRSACAIAARAGVSPSVIGMTIVAAGTSMPEMVVSVNASLAGQSSLAMGNVLGSNIFNMAAILGIAALIAPLRVTGQTVKVEWPAMMGASVLLALFAWDRQLGRAEGLFLVSLLVGFTIFLIRRSRTQTLPTEKVQFEAQAKLLGGTQTPSGFWLRTILGTLLGCAFLAAGAEVLLRGATDIALHFHMSPGLIGILILATGTSLPELVASCVASWRGHDDVAIANVLGSNIFNALGITGVAASIQPMRIEPELLNPSMLAMLLVSVLLFPLMRSGYLVSRKEGLLLLLAYWGYLVLAIASDRPYLSFSHG